MVFPMQKPSVPQSEASLIKKKEDVNCIQHPKIHCELHINILHAHVSIERE